METCEPNNKAMKTETKRRREISQLQLALGMAGLVTNDKSVDLILRVQSAVKKLGGKFTLKDACQISAEVEEYHTDETIARWKREQIPLNTLKTKQGDA